MQETRVLVETKGTTGEETISYWFELPIDVAEFEEKLGIGAESGDYRIIEKVLPYLMYFGLNLIIFFLIYSIYWIATYIGFKRNINEAS